MTIPALGHDPEISNAKPATCVDEGYSGDEVCARCGEVLKEGEVIPATGHAWGAWLETKEPTCTEQGVEECSCVACGATEQRLVEALGHDFQDGVCTACGASDPSYTPPKDPEGPAEPQKPSHSQESTEASNLPATGDFAFAMVAGAAVLAGIATLAIGASLLRRSKR